MPKFYYTADENGSCYVYRRGCKAPDASRLSRPAAARLVATLNDGGVPGQKYVKFWERVNGGWVKLTLFPGDSLTHNRYARTDEGFRAETESWWVCEATGLLHNRVEGEERDCDGLCSYEHHYVVETTRAKLNYDPADPECPVWRREYSQNRDHTAEAAGY
jgi:hypothetical protein